MRYLRASRAFAQATSMVELALLIHMEALGSNQADLAFGTSGRVAITLALPQRLQRNRFTKLARGASGFKPKDFKVGAVSRAS